MLSKHYKACPIKMNTSCDTTSGKSARSAIKHNTQSLSSLKFLTLTLSAPPLTGPKVVVAGTSDRIVVTNRSKYGDCVILSVAESAHLLDFRSTSIRNICQFNHRPQNGDSIRTAVIHANAISPVLACCEQQ